MCDHMPRIAIPDERPLCGTRPKDRYQRGGSDLTFSKDSLPESIEPGTRGFVFATTGQLYTDLARRAARTLRTAMPDASIDLFTDQPVTDDVFDKVHALTDTTHRPKTRAIRHSRFERTILLDADVFVLTDISEVFEVLDRYDIVGVLGNSRTRRQIPADRQVPSCLNPVNTGMLAFRASAALHAFSRTWEEEINSNNELVDQPAFRKLIYLSDLKFGTLGPAYNCIKLDLLDVWTASMGAPRILHIQSLHEDHPGDPETPYDLDEVIGKTRARHVRALLAADWTLGGDDQKVAKAPNEVRRAELKQLKANAPKTQTRQTGRGNLIGGLFGKRREEDRTPDQKPQKSPARRKQKFPEYHAAILALASQGRPVRICVIGANDGKANDPIYFLVRDNLRSNSQILLFEPQPYLLQFLKKNYSFHPAHKIINAAVGPQDSLTLHAVRPEHWDRFNPSYAAKWPTYRAPTGVTSFDRENVVGWVRKHLPDEKDPDSLVAELTVPSGRLVPYVQDHWQDTTIDVLQIDAEGFDDEVIYACDIEVTQPKIIRFESAHLSAERLARLREHLSENYLLVELGRDMLGIRRG